MQKPLCSRAARKIRSRLTQPRLMLIRSSALQDIVKNDDENRILEALSTPTGHGRLIHLVGNTQVASRVASLTDDHCAPPAPGRPASDCALSEPKAGSRPEGCRRRLRLNRARVDKDASHR